MEIVEKDFKLVPSSSDSLLWDLSLLKVVNKGKENERIKFDTPKYGLTLERALSLAAHSRICAKFSEQEINLHTYISEFKKIKKEIEEICNLAINIEKS